jgi:hypothetical protein
METKVCNECGLEKSLSEFYKRTDTPTGYRNNCKECKLKNNHRWRKENKENVSNISKIWRELNKGKIRENEKRWRESNKEKLYLKKKEYRETNKEKIIEVAKKYRNTEKYKEYQKKYKEKNKEKILEQQRNRKEYYLNYRKTRYSNDVLYRLKDLCRTRIREILNIKNLSKKNKTFEIVGCSPEFLKEHLESQFKDGMSWENRSEWHIDHIIPLSSAKTEDELYKLCHYTNLQPLWAEENLKKSNKIIV